MSTSSFGFGGTNAHVVLQQFKDPTRFQGRRDRDDTSTAGPVVLPLSAALESVCSTADRYRRSIAASRQTWRVADVAWTAAKYRVHDPRRTFRAAVIAADHEQMQAGLADIAAGRSSGSSTMVGKTVGSSARVAFVFTGQGAQHPEMCRGLFKSNGTFRKAMEKCDALLSEHMALPLLATLYSGNRWRRRSMQDPAFLSQRSSPSSTRSQW